MKRWALVLLIGLFFSPLRAQAEQRAIRVGYLPLVMSLPTFVAHEKGFFAAQGLKVELVPFQSGTTILDALVAGRIDANCGSAITGHWFAEQNVPGRFKIFLVYGNRSLEDNTFVVVVRNDAPYTGLKDLKGRRVGTFPGATSLALARAVLRKVADPEKVIFTEVPPPNMVPALAAGQIDAFFTPEPLGMIAVAKGIGRYLMKSPMKLLGLKRGIPGGAFSFSRKFLKDRPQDAQRLRMAYHRAVDFIKAREREARAFLVKYARMPEPVAMRIPFEQWIKIEESDRGAAQQYFDVLYEEGAYRKRIDTGNLFYSPPRPR